MRKLGMFLLGFAAVLFAGGAVQAAMSEDDTDNKFSIHGEVRFRGEAWSNLTDFTDTGSSTLGGSSDDDFDIFPYRVRLAAKGDLGHDIWVYGEFQASGAAGGGLFGQTDPFFGDSIEFLDSGVSLYQGYVKLKDIGSSNLDLTLGRQEIVFDRGLHFSSLDFYNGISHDGAMANWDWDRFNISAFWTRVSDSNLAAVTLSPNSGGDQDILGGHVGWMIGKDKDQDVAGYAFLQTQNNTIIDPANNERRGKIYTIGGRWGRMIHGKNGFEWNAEASYQFGDFQPCAAPFPFNIDIAGGGTLACSNGSAAFPKLDQKAWVFEGSFGYAWHGGKTDQKIWGGYTMASGDSDPNDKDNESFVPLFTDFHNRLGYADLFTISNIQALSVGWRVNVDDKHGFGVALWNFKQDNTEAGSVSPLTFGSTGSALADPCFNGTTPPPGQSCNDDLGNEVDLFYDYNMTENFSFNTALSWFDPGDAIKDHWSGFGATSDGGDAGWRLTAQARARF